MFLTYPNVKMTCISMQTASTVVPAMQNSYLPDRLVS